MLDSSIFQVFVIFLIVFVGYFVKRRLTASKSRQQNRQQQMEKNFRSGKHLWKTFNKKGLFYCNACGQLMQGLFCQGISECSKCGLLVHSVCKNLKQKKIQKCKFVTKEQTDSDVHIHQFIEGNLPFNAVCSVCNLICSSMYELKGSKCIWCQKYFHTDCKEKIQDQQCDCSYLKNIVLKPTQVKFKKPQNAIINESSKKKNYNSENDTEPELDVSKQGWTFKPSPQQSPIVVIINKKSGGQLGLQFMNAFYKHLNPIQVIDLLKEGLDRLTLFKDIRNLRVLVCGGDGTVASVVNFMKSSNIQQWKDKNPPVAILPIGTGNDLGRALGWGGGGQTEDQVGQILKTVDKKSQALLHDRWQVKFSNKKMETQILYNYISFGLDARVCYGFHDLRSKYPYLFKSRIGNKFIYTHVGTVDMLQQKTQQLIGNGESLDKQIDLIVDGVKIDLPEIENLAFVNISSWAGGAQNLWYNEKEIKIRKANQLIYKPQSFSDGIIEVLGVESMFHLGQVQININEPIRICQGKKIQIKLKAPQHMQIDGEPFFVKEQTIDLQRFDQVHLLTNTESDVNQQTSAQTSLQFQSKILNTLEWAEQNDHINQGQKKVLLEKFLE